jgi:hypothetical protein
MKFKVPKHDRDCAFRQAKGVTSVRCTCKAKFGGKPFAHWQDMAEELVADCLLRDIDRMDDEYSLPRYLAHVRLLDIARREVPQELLTVMEQRDRAIQGLQAFMDDVCRGKKFPNLDLEALGFPDKREQEDAS